MKSPKERPRPIPYEDGTVWEKAWVWLSLFLWIGGICALIVDPLVGAAMLGAWVVLFLVLYAAAWTIAWWHRTPIEKPRHDGRPQHPWRATGRSRAGV